MRSVRSGRQYVDAMDPAPPPREPGSELALLPALAPSRPCPAAAAPRALPRASSSPSSSPSSEDHCSALPSPSESPASKCVAAAPSAACSGGGDAALAAPCAAHSHAWPHHDAAFCPHARAGALVARCLLPYTPPATSFPSRTAHGSSNSRMNAAPQASLGTEWLGRCTLPYPALFRTMLAASTKSSSSASPPPSPPAPPPASSSACIAAASAPTSSASARAATRGRHSGATPARSRASGPEREVSRRARMRVPPLECGSHSANDQLRRPRHEPGAPGGPARTERGRAARRRPPPGCASACPRVMHTAARGARARHMRATSRENAVTPLALCAASSCAAPGPRIRAVRGRPERQLWWQVCLTVYSLALTPCTLRRADVCCMCSDAAPCRSAQHSDRVLHRRLVEARVGTEDHYTHEGFAQWVAGRSAHIGDGGLVQRQPARVKCLDVIGRLLHGRRRHIHGRACCPAQCLSEPQPHTHAASPSRSTRTTLAALGLRSLQGARSSALATLPTRKLWCSRTAPRHSTGSCAQEHRQYRFRVSLRQSAALARGRAPAASSSSCARAASPASGRPSTRPLPPGTRRCCR